MLLSMMVGGSYSSWALDNTWSSDDPSELRRKATLWWASTRTTKWAEKACEVEGKFEFKFEFKLQASTRIIRHESLGTLSSSRVLKQLCTMVLSTRVMVLECLNAQELATSRLTDPN